MEPHVKTFLFFLLVMIRMVSSARSQNTNPQDLLPVNESPAREISLSNTPDRQETNFRTLNPDPIPGDIPDTALFDIHSIINNAPVYNPSMLIILQSVLEKHEILLEYFPVDTTIYIIAITHEHTGIYSCWSGGLFWPEIQKLLRKIKLAEIMDFQAQSVKISHVLLDPVADKLKEKSRVIIIAHNSLNGFPFETLCFSSPNPIFHNKKDYHYLIEDHQIVYSPSIPHWLSTRYLSMIKKTRSRQDRWLAFVGFSPGFEAHDCVQRLQDSENEVHLIGRMFEEKGLVPMVLVNENSNEHNFRSVAQYSNILHLATHTLSDDEFPETNGLLFWEFGAEQGSCDQDDGILEVHEICKLKIPAELIVLNSCASASIKSRNDMKWYSSADCFMKAGVKNILCTLWNVTDRFAQQFMVEFYRCYLSGMSFSQALQKVKIQMINEPSTSLPINWAAYVLIGE
jgi:CHAT domain-containing protein